MAKVIVAFSKPEDGKNIKNVLVKHGFDVCAVCTSGSQVLNCADSLGEGIIVCGCYFADMMYGELRDCLSVCFDMLLVASPGRLGGRALEGVACLDLPLKVHDLVETLEEMERFMARQRKLRRLKPKERSAGQQKVIDDAKAALMERRGMTEKEAHRFLQKHSMDTGSDLEETAQKVLRLMENEGD